MGKKLYRQETSGEIHALNPQSHYVALPPLHPQGIEGNPLTNASSRPSVPSGGPVALSSVIESVYQRQIALNSAPHSAIQREPTLNSAPGSAAKRVMEAPTSATLESLSIESLREWEESPLSLIEMNLNHPERPNHPPKLSKTWGETAPSQDQPAILAGQVFTPHHGGQGEHG
ncbi:MAG: hypothetical protein IT322_18125 [Anaerolineae bacterium]|nr:hypothetical protein [Anaerolineae bacterium]